MTPVEAPQPEAMGPSGPMTPVSTQPSGPMTPVSAPTAGPRGAGGLANQPASLYTGAKGFYNLNPSLNVMQDFGTDWSAGKGGVLPGFRTVATKLAAQYRLGIYDFNAGHGDPNHLGSADPHLSGRAMDVDTVNGETVGGELTPGIAKFVISTLSQPGTRVGLGGDLYKYFAKMPTYQGRVFQDEPTHVHVELTPEMAAYYGKGKPATPTAMTPVSKADIGAAAKAVASTGPSGKMTPVTASVLNPYLGPPSLAGVGSAVAGAWNALDRTGKDVEEFNERIMHYPLEGMDAILGAGQRFVAGATTTQMKQMQAAAAQHANPAQAVFGAMIGGHMQGLYDAFHPSDMPRQAQVIQDTLSMLHLPMNDTGWKRAGEVFLAQTLTDPLSVLPWMKTMAEAAKVPGAMRAVQAGMGEGKDMSFLRGLVGQQATESIAKASAQAKVWMKQTQDFFSSRPELSENLDNSGKAYRLGIENRVGKYINASETADTQMLEGAENQINTFTGNIPKQIAQRILQPGYVYGDTHMRAMAQAMGYEPTAAEMAAEPAKLLSYNVQARYRGLLNSLQAEGADVMGILKDHLADGRQMLGKTLVNTETQRVLERYGGWIGDGPIDASKLSQSGAVIGAKSPLRVLGTLGKESVMANPFPHGIKNVGILQYLRGGLPAFGKGLMYATRGITDEAAQRLSVMGEDAPEYLRDLKGPWKRVPLVRGVVGIGQKILNRLEGGYRSALLDHLDKEVGPSLTEADELLKGQMIRDALGDYKNVSAFVSMLQAMGGPFVAFRVGIVPKAVSQAIVRNPQRVEGLTRAQKDIEDNTGMEIGGPISDFAKMTAGPYSALGFFDSPSTTGPVGSAVQFGISGKMGTPTPPKELMAQTAFQYAGPFSALGSLWGIPYPAPGKQMGQFDLRSALLSLMSFYETEGWNPKAERRTEHFIETH
jgi:hypothetical protein